MRLRVVAIPLFAAICLASPAITSAEQAQRGRGYRPRDGGGGQTAERSGGDNRGGGERNRTAGTNQHSTPARAACDRRLAPRTAAPRTGERYRAPPRQRAARHQPARRSTRSSSPRNRPDININIGSSYRGPRYYAPVHYDMGAAVLPLESDRLRAVVADLRIDRLGELRLLRRVSRRARTTTGTVRTRTVPAHCTHRGN